MADTCTCGTVLVEDASFCHRCGKAQREFLAPEPADPDLLIEAAPLQATPQPGPSRNAESAVSQPVSFANAVAVRVGFLTASVAAMLDAIPLVGALFILWSALAGYFSVMLYRRRTGQVLTVRSGAKMGWITGVLNAMIVIIFATLAFASSISDFTANYRQQLATLQSRDPSRYAAAAGFLESPYALATGMIILLFAMFVIFTLAGTAGGALGAKVGKKN